MKNILIMAAGKSSRFGKAKCLTKIGKTTVLENLIKLAKSSRNRVIVVVSNNVFEQDLEMIKTICDKTHTIIINSKYTNGTANNLKDYAKYVASDAFIMWSDIIVADESNFVKFLKTDFNHVLTIPVVFEKEPYAAVLVDDSGVPFDMLYSKKTGERPVEGYHDQCIFYIPELVWQLCFNSIKEIDGEKNILDIISIAHNKGLFTEIIKYPNKLVNSFNTVEELKNLKKLKKT